MATNEELMAKLKNRRILPELGDMAPIPNEKLPINPMPGTEVIITKAVKDWLDKIANKTFDTNKEIMFFMFGKVKGQQVIFDAGFVDNNNIGDWDNASASPALNKALNDFIANAPKDGSCIVGWGHTHARIGKWYTNFSFADMTGLTEFRNGYDVFRGKDGIPESEQINLCAVLLTGGNYNFVFFNGEDYYRFSKVFVIDEFNRKTQLPCYGPDIALTQTRFYRNQRG